MQQDPNERRPEETNQITPSNNAATGEGTGSAVGSYGGPADATEATYPTSDDADTTSSGAAAADVDPR